MALASPGVVVEEILTSDAEALRGIFSGKQAYRQLLSGVPSM
jgi:hypothetical protein